jgi:hypothetical protein
VATRVTAPYRFHFGAIYVALAVVLAAAVAATVVLVARDAPAGAPAWSTWQPVGSADAKVEQIRGFISDEYRLPNGNAFAVVRAGPPTEQGVPIPSYVIRRAAALKTDFDTISAKNSVVYTVTMCGLTVDCEHLTSHDAADISRTLRREALELSLYTLKYVDDVPNVLVELPALTKNGVAPAVFFQRSDLADGLRRPLRETLPPHPVVLPGLGGPRELATIDRLTVTHLYQPAVNQDPSGAPVLVLNPVQP